MRNERVSRHFSLVEPFSALGYSVLKFQASTFFSLSHSLSTAALASGIVTASLLDVGLCTRPSYNFRHQPFFRYLVHLVGAVVLPVLGFYLLISVGSGFFLSGRKSSGLYVPRAPSVGIHGIERATHLFEFCSSFGDDLGVVCVFGPNVEEPAFSASLFAMCSFSSSMLAIASFVSWMFLAIFSGPIVAGREHVHYTCVSLWAVFRIARMVLVHVVISSWFGIVGSVFPVTPSFLA